MSKKGNGTDGMTVNIDIEERATPHVTPLTQTDTLSLFEYTVYKLLLKSCTSKDFSFPFLELTDAKFEIK